MGLRRRWSAPAIAVLTLVGCADDGAGDLDEGAGSTGSDDAADVAGSTDGQPDDGPVDGTSDQPQPVCGDGTVDADEECDDGNAVDGDGCNVDCVPSGSVRWTVEWDGAGSDISTPHVIVAGDRAIAYVELGWDMGSNWAGQSIFHVVDREGVEHATLNEPSGPDLDHLEPLHVAGFPGGDFGVLRLATTDPTYTLTRYDASAVVIDAIPIAVEGTPRRFAPQPGRFAIASSAFGTDDAWLTGFDAAGAAQWQGPARDASLIAVTPDGSIGVRWSDSGAKVPFGLAAYDPLGELIFETPIPAQNALNSVVGSSDGWWLMVSGQQSRVYHYALDGTQSDVATVDGSGFRITPMPDGDAAISYHQDGIETVARIGRDGTIRWQTQMPSDVEVWNLAAGSDGFVWAVGQDTYEDNVAAQAYLWGIAP